MKNDLKSILIDEESLRQKVKELGDQISKDYAGKNPLFVSILKGSVVFLSDLMRQTDIPLNIDFMSVSSYGAQTESSGVVRILKDLDSSVNGRDILIIEDILDSGLTLDYLIRLLEERSPSSIKLCVLLHKHKSGGNQLAREVDYLGFSIEDEFVVGYGLDYNEKYRNLPYIAVLKDEIYL